MQAGRLQQIITIWQPTTTRTATGAESTTYKLCYECRAAVSYKSMDRVNENGDMFYSRGVSFEIRTPFFNIDERLQIHWHDKKYRIISVEPRIDNMSVVIYTEMINE
jgi:head-tail adaptor